MNELTALFELIFLDEKKGRKARGHDAMVAELRRLNANEAAIGLIDIERGESNLFFPILAGTLPHGSLAQQWAMMTFTGGATFDWDWGYFLSWRDYCEKVGFDPQAQNDLGISIAHEDAWNEWRESNAYKSEGEAVAIGCQAGGECVWALPNGEVWLALGEPGEIPFLKLFPNLEHAIQKVDNALSSGDLVRESEGIWHWGEYIFEDGDDSWVLKE